MVILIISRSEVTNSPKIQIVRESKQRTMQRKKTVSLVLFFVTLALLFIVLSLLGMTNMDLFLAEVGAGLLFLALGILWWGFKGEIESFAQGVPLSSETEMYKELDQSAESIEPLDYLTVFFSHKAKDINELINSIQLKYVVNKDTRQAFLMPNWLNPLIKKGKISTQIFDGEHALRNYIKKTYGKEGLIEREASPQDLRLKREGNKIILVSDTVDRVKAGLQDKILEGFQAVFLQRIDFREVPNGKIHAQRVLLIVKETEDAYVEEAPFLLELIDKGIIIDYQRLGMYPWEGLGRWCKRQHYNFHRYRYDWSKMVSQKEVL